MVTKTEKNSPFSGQFPWELTATLLDSSGFLTGEKKLILLKKINDVCQVSFFIREGVSLDENLKKYLYEFSGLKK